MVSLILLEVSILQDMISTVPTHPICQHGSLFSHGGADRSPVLLVWERAAAKPSWRFSSQLQAVPSSLLLQSSM